jgi:hypothetical protein
MEPPDEYFKAVVEPAYADFLAEPLSRHRATSAATIVHHFYERLYWYFKEYDPARLHGCAKDTDYLTFLTQHCRDLALLRDSAESVKHQFLDRGLDYRLVATATGVTNRIGNEFVIGNTGRTVSTLLDSVMKFWRGMLATGSP